MATILDKDITRESTVKHENREIQVTLTSDQNISMKLKGMKSGSVSISVEELYKQLACIDKPSPLMAGERTGPTEFITEKVEKKDKNYNNSPMINLYDLRSLSAITVMPMETKVLFERIIVELINRGKKTQ